MSTQRKLIYNRFNRFWHWSQALLILLLALTGFDMRFSLGLFGFENAMDYHIGVAFAFAVLTVFAIFWHVTTGAWQQYWPLNASRIGAMVRYYTGGIFRNEPHPIKKTELSKLNPLQRLAYTGLKLFTIPLVVVTGILYYFYNSWEAIGLEGVELGTMAFLHVLGAYLLLVFTFGHIYLTTTGHTPLSNIKAMITGWEDIEEE